MCRVVVDGADDDTAGPGSDSGQRLALEFSSVIARLHVFHLAMFSIGDPGGKDVEFAEVADGSNSAEIESGIAGALFDAGWKVGWQVGSGRRGFFRSKLHARFRFLAQRSNHRSYPSRRSSRSRSHSRMFTSNMFTSSSCLTRLVFLSYRALSMLRTVEQSVPVTCGLFLVSLVPRCPMRIF